jgi:hypothetical protein
MKYARSYYKCNSSATYKSSTVLMMLLGLIRTAAIPLLLSTDFF